ncbi:hypothetical protein Bca4012_044854 [Brassica carinata]|uniref:Uncharacterized protein n=1 Tax=Brassica carinata TaxID=52824 RepID=A0A8X7QQW7_BRACI|nr:hypothetical protein Bca52824_057689 [Brassica carinata]
MKPIVEKKDHMGEKIVHQWHEESLDEVHHLKRSITESNELSYLVIFVIRTNQNPQGIWRSHNRPGAWRFPEVSLQHRHDLAEDHADADREIDREAPRNGRHQGQDPIRRPCSSTAMTETASLTVEDTKKLLRKSMMQ